MKVWVFLTAIVIVLLGLIRAGNIELEVEHGDGHIDHHHEDYEDHHSDDDSDDDDDDDDDDDWD